MIVDFAIENEQIVSLSVIKKDDAENRYQLIDDEKFVWMEIEINSPNIKIIIKDNRIIDDEDSIESKLDNLLYEIIEIEKSGTDNFSNEDSTELNPYNPDEIKVRTDKLNITLLSTMIDNGDIDLNPDFQRNLVWNNFQKSLLIESILLRIPLPMFYFAEDYEGKLSVVDGLQRISTIKEFMDNKFPLKHLQYLKDSCGDKYYKDSGLNKGLDSKYFRWFNLTSITANFIDPTSPYKVKYDIFRRINTGGRPLNNQEIRNCLTGQVLRDILKEMVQLPEFFSATDFSIKKTRMDDQEIALRFLMFYQWYEGSEFKNIDKYNGYMDSSLDEFTESNIKSKKEDLVKYVALFSNAMKNAEYLIGRRYSFRKIQTKDVLPHSYKQLLNKALFVCTSILLANYSHNKITSLNEANSLRNKLAEKIEKDYKLFNYLSYGTNGRANLTYTFDILKELISQNIKY
jgi:Protein of unknown function DUF262